ncbi:penicillin acylase family protein [Nitrosomonas sp.]|uniref:penicillin acylase family protein n=1 Tax=Nitrosomonas sp. TaxID=42353 RepID=UPI0025E50089|nr:penicillin acylase family protein [Nitrosomonas sp.]
MIIAAGLLLRGSLPQYDGEATLPGLIAPVISERDALGSVTLKGGNRVDLAMAMGYVHAQERFFEMDLMRRQAAGELAELFGINAISHDRKIRLLRLRTRATAVLQQLPSDQTQLLDAYRMGVNRGLQALAVRPFPYLLTRTHPVPWRNEDSILVILAMFLTLNEENFSRELALSSMRAVLPKPVYEFLTSPAGNWDAPLIDEPVQLPRLPSAMDINLQTMKEPTPQSDFFMTEQSPGSNSFAVSGKLSGGAAIVANDMHLKLRVPNTWFRLRLIYPDAASDRIHDVTGISLPGVPSIVVGSNRHIAWSFTNSHGDFSDWVRISINEDNRMQYRNSKGWQPIQTFNETIRIKNAPDEQLMISETEWGPLIKQDYDQTPLALAWTALHPEAINLKLLELEQITTAEQAANLARQFGIPVQNFIAGDRDGNISWTLAGRIPDRFSDYDPQASADWSLPGTGWRGWLDYDLYPLLHNPSSGRLWSANSRTVSGEQLKRIGNGGYDLGARATQIRHRLFAHDQFSIADLQAIQLDDHAILLTRWYELLLETIGSIDAGEMWLHPIKAALADWTGEASIDSAAYHLAHAFRYEVIDTILNGFMSPIRQSDAGFQSPRLSQTEWIVWQLLEQQPRHLLPSPHRNWNDLLFHCLQTVTSRMNKDGRVTIQKWGTVNAAQIKHPVSRQLPDWIARWLDMANDPLPGDHNMPRVQSPNFGASQRSVIAPGQEEQSYFDMPGGQSGHPLSPYYGSGHANWVRGKPTPLLPGIVERQLKLLPIN